MKPKPRVNNVDDTSSQAAATGTSATVAEQVNKIETMMQKHSIYDANYDSDYDEFDDNRVGVISDSDSIRELEPLNMHICFRNTETKTQVDLGCVCTIINRCLADAVVLNSQENFWVDSPKNLDLNNIFNETIKTVGGISTSVKCNNWAAEMSMLQLLKLVIDQ